MGDNIIIQDVQIENDGTLLQVDTDKGRMFIEMKLVYKALNNYAYLKYDESLKSMGFELEDPENYKNPNLIN